MIFAASGVSPLDVVFGVLGSGGLVSAFVALYKLRPDMNTAAVTQAQGAAESLAVALPLLQAERDEWRARALSCEEQVRELREKLEVSERAHGRRRQD